MLLDVPPGSSITLDGVTRLTPAPSSSSSSSSSSAARRLSSLPSSSFDRGLWIIDGIPSSSSSTSNSTSSSGEENGDGDFHLLVVRPGTADGGRRALPVGFVLTSPSGGAASSDDNGGCCWTFARRYDVRIEEMSDEAVDGLTLGNVLRAAEAGGELFGSVIPHGRFTGTDAATSSPPSASPNDYTVGNAEGGGGSIVPPPWDVRTSSIGADFLRSRHGMSHGSKLLPSSSGGSPSAGVADSAAAAAGGGGASASYPPIPCVDRDVCARALARHAGTRAYLSGLTPPERTRLLLLGAASSAAAAEDDDDDDGDGDDAVCRNPGEYVLEDVLRRYDGRADGAVGGTGDGVGGGTGGVDCSRGEDHFLADVELSFLLLLHLECHASLEYWRDAVSMCSLATTATVGGATKKAAAAVGETTPRAIDSGGIVVRRSRFFRKLLSVLRNQLSCIETAFFREVEYSSGENNFLVGALRRLCDACESCVIDVVKRKRGDDGAIEGLRTASRELRRLVRDRFGLDLSYPTGDDVNVNDDDDMETDALWSITGDDYGDDDPDGTGMRECNTRESPGDGDDIEGDDDDDDDEDGPVMIPYDQIEASIARSALQSSQSSKLHGGGLGGQRHSQHCEEYPLLYAAMSPGEDEVMACARILDEAGDVSLVREAAAYLEEVEVHR